MEFGDNGSEARQHARLSVGASIYVSYLGRLYSGQVEEMSTQAVNASIDAPKVPLGAQVDVILSMRGGQKVNFVGKIVRKGSTELIIQEARGSREVLRNFFFQMA